ncbi:hypothetical protein F4780DRAFT_263345 [Xylariomycetidae sp. FL0641]|nr:hypothetical protein F4780DRAFT_263345 [Xylariomycetidae sp. FL0641]
MSLPTEAANAKPKMAPDPEGSILEETQYLRTPEPGISEPTVVPQIPEVQLDLTLVVGTSPGTRMRVSSRALTQNVVYFDKLLNGPFAERKPDQGPWIVHLPDDDPFTLGVIFRVLHRTPPSSYSLHGYRSNRMYRLTAAIHYFDVYKFFKGQASSNAFALDQLPYLEIDDKDLWVAWNLGCKFVIERSLKKFVMETRLDKGQPVDEDGTPRRLNWHLQEFGLEANLAKERGKYMYKIAKPWFIASGKLEETDRPKDEFFCKNKAAPRPESRRICHRTLLGSLHLEFLHLKTNRKDYFGSSTLSLSANELSKRMSEFQIQGIEPSWRDHVDCNPTDRCRREVEEATRQPICLLTNAHRRYLAGQRKLWGLPPPLDLDYYLRLEEMARIR